MTDQVSYPQQFQTNDAGEDSRSCHQSPSPSSRMEAAPNWRNVDVVPDRKKNSVGEDSAYVTGSGSNASMSSSSDESDGHVIRDDVTAESMTSTSPQTDSSRRKAEMHKKRSWAAPQTTWHTGNEDEYQRLAVSDDESCASLTGNRIQTATGDETVFVAPTNVPPYAMISVTGSTRRRLGKKRGGSGCDMAATSQKLSVTGDELQETSNTSAVISSNSAKTEKRRSSVTSPNSSSPQLLQRAPSSLFYLNYDDEDDDDDDDDDQTNDNSDDSGTAKRRRLPRSDLPSSRKFSAAPYMAPRIIQIPSDDDDDVDDDLTTKDDYDDDDVRVEGHRTGKFRRDVVRTAVTSIEDYYEDTLKQIDALTKVFRLSDDVYCDIKTLLNAEMDRGLQRATHSSATVKMFHTHVRAVPDGSEFGRYVALDLGGTNFRVLVVELKGRQPPDVISKVFLIPMRIMLGPGKQLFDHIVKCIADFLDSHGLKSERMPLGFTFSFPCIQDGLASARLVRWTKGFKCSEVENENVVQLLHEAIARRGDLNLECVAVLNDNVGVLMAGARCHSNCRIGLILGTGTNCCYLEDLERVELWQGVIDEPKKMIINTEWGAFGDDGVLDFVRNQFDRRLDVTSLNPGHQLFEKMISGMYMGEIVRLILCDLTLRGIIFKGRDLEALFESQRFYTKYISEIESDDPTGDYPNTRLVLQELAINDVTRDDCRYVQHVCWQVSQRAAFLASTAVAVVIERVNLDDVTVAVDGSLYRFHPHFKDLMNSKIAQLTQPQQKFKLILADDGSGQGAALVAAVAVKDRLQAT